MIKIQLIQVLSSAQSGGICEVCINITRRKLEDVVHMACIYTAAETYRDLTPCKLQVATCKYPGYKVIHRRWHCCPLHKHELNHKEFQAINSWQYSMQCSLRLLSLFEIKETMLFALSETIAICLYPVRRLTSVYESGYVSDRAIRRFRNVEASRFQFQFRLPKDSPFHSPYT